MAVTLTDSSSNILRVFSIEIVFGKRTTLLGAEEKRFRLSEMISEHRKRFADRNDFHGGPLDNSAAVSQLAYPPTARYNSSLEVLESFSTLLDRFPWDK